MNEKTTHLDDTIDLKELFFDLLEQWKLIAIFILFSILAAILFLRTTDTIYQADALIQIKSNSSSPLANLSADMAAMASFAGLSSGGSSTQGEIELLKSRSIFGQAIQDLHLDISIQSQQNLFEKVFSPDLFITEYNKQGVIIESDKLNLKILKFNTPKDYENRSLRLAFNLKDYVIFDTKTDEILAKGQLNKILIQGGWDINIIGQTLSPTELIIQKNSLPNAMVSSLNNFNVQEKGKGTGILELTYLGQNKTNIPEILNSVLNNYKQNDINRSITDKNQQVDFLEKQLPKLKQELDDSEKQFNQFRSKFDTIDVKQESELYLKQNIELETQKIQLQQKQAELSTQYTSEHPAMHAISAQLETIENKINETNEKIKKLPEVQRLYLQYYRDVEIKNKLYTNLLGTYQSLNVAKAGELGKVDIIDYALEPVKPLKPRKLIILILSVFVGGFIGVLIALVRNMLNSGVRNLTPVAEKYSIKNFGSINENILLNSQSKNYMHPLAVLEPSNLVIEQIRTLATAIHHISLTKPQAIVQMVGATKNTGTSILIANVAITLAQMNVKVLLIDTDLRHGQLENYFNIETTHGLTDYLEDKTQLNNVIVKTQQSNLDLISHGQNHTNPTSLFSTAKMAHLLEQLTQDYDVILLDGSPIVDVSDSQILAKYAATNILVTRFNHTSVDEIDKTVESFKNSGHRFDAMVLNFSK